MTVRPPEAPSTTDFDPGALNAYLDRRLPDARGEMRLQRVGGGQSNPTYFVSFDNYRLVLRKQPSGEHPPGSHDVAREYKALACLEGGEVPAPAPILLETDRSVIGTAFYLMERIDGRIFHDHRLQQVAGDQRRDIFLSMADALAAVHTVEWRSTPLIDFVRPGSFLERQIQRWAKSWADAVGEAQTQAAAVVEWLSARRPDETSALIHGDLKLSNVICHAAEPRILAILDWELFTIGDPMLDLAHTIVAIWRTRPDEYGGLLGCELQAMGLPTEGEFLERYYAKAARGPRLSTFYLVLAMLRLAGIFRGIGQRAKAGIAAAEGAAETARLAEVYLARAYGLVRAQP